jgi:flagellin
MTVINTNIKALYTQQALKISARDSQVAMQQLSTGKRINSSKDDAAGLAIAARMTQNIQGLKQAVRNAGDAISLIQTAEGATTEISAMLQRMSELAVQSANSTYSSDQRGYLDQEFQQLKQEIIRISETHEWNGFPILNGKAGVPVGAPTATTNVRDFVASDSAGKTLGANDLVISSGDPLVAWDIAASSASDDEKSSGIAASSEPGGSAIAIAAAINKKLSVTGVAATANGAVIEANLTEVDTTQTTQTDLYINGTKISLSLSSSHSSQERRQYVMDSINSSTSSHGVKAADSGSGGLSLKTVDGRNLSVWYDNLYDGYDFGLGIKGAIDSDPDGVTGVAAADLDAATVNASTVYGTVTLNSMNAFTIGAGSALPDADGKTNFELLGFNGVPVIPKNIGRLSFQVGPAPDQLISIDLSDFGKNGDVTNMITGDEHPTNLNTVENANVVMQAVNQSLDRVAQTRATMGAVMNRLQHVIDNVTNVVTTSEASRSQIEDADYATASTELSRTQIMQQAATAVLAQANTDQQTVLKLLQ